MVSDFGGNCLDRLGRGKWFLADKSIFVRQKHNLLFSQENKCPLQKQTVCSFINLFRIHTDYFLRELKSQAKLQHIHTHKKNFRYDKQ